MRRVTRIGVLVLAASGAMAVTVPAYSALAADADGAAAGSPGVISGNLVQLPVDVPVNVCGNTVSVVGVLNPAAGNKCANAGGAGGLGEGAGPSAGSAGASARGGTADSPGLVSGNGVQLPVELPVNVTGNSVNVVGIGNPAFGNASSNTSDDRPEPPRPPARPEPRPEPKPEPKPVAPPEKTTPPRHAPHLTQRVATASLARTGADQTLPALAGGAALVLGGAVLYRRYRPAARG
ncbi:chaplin [Streptomyces ziwulingensis]|uniref:LAXTG-anchored chaplin ChpB n=1 Tax=Streptomyces ziwulingensis TaxID=1045501 RepID=A0ABP9BAH0_9ACTN